MGFATNAGNDSLFKLRNSDTIYGKNGNAFYHSVFPHPDNSDQRENKNYRMSELQNKISNRMKNFLQSYKLLIAIFLLVVMLSSCFLDNKPKLDIINEVHEKILVNNIDPITEKYGLTKLREFNL